MDWLQVDGITAVQQGYHGVSDIRLSLGQGERVSIAGETGSGKTTLLKLIGGLLDATSGTVYFEGKKVTGPLFNLIPGHPGIAFLGQHFELRNNYRVEEILAFNNGLNEPEVKELVSVCRIEPLLKRKTQQLSGGERQRIALAALLLTKPRLLLLDEPFSNLDARHRSLIKSVLADVESRLGVTMILVSHDYRDLLAWAGRIIVLQSGTLIQSASPPVIYRQPINEYTAALFGSYNLLLPQQAAGWNQPAFHGEKARLIRPVDIDWTRDGTGVKGRIRQVDFVGSHYRLTVDTPAGIWQLTTTVQPPESGAVIGLIIRPDTAAHYIPLKNT